MAAFRRTDLAETPSPALDALEGTLPGLIRLAVLLVVDLNGVSGASLPTFDEAIGTAESQVRALLLDDRLSERQRAVLNRTIQTVQLSAVIGRSSPHLQRLTIFLLGGPMGEVTGDFLKAVREPLAGAGAHVVSVVRSRDVDTALALRESLREQEAPLAAAREVFLESVTRHEGARRLSGAACLALDVVWTSLREITERFAEDLSRTPESRDGLLAPLRRAA
jgi:hypothetical protein